MLGIGERNRQLQNGLSKAEQGEYWPGRRLRRVHFRDYFTANISRFVRACILAEKINASIDEVGFQQIIERHNTEGPLSRRHFKKYFKKRMWLRAKAMRAIELGLDQCRGASVLDLGCGAGYFLYACKYLGHHVSGLDRPSNDYFEEMDFFDELIAFLHIPRTSFAIEPYKPLPSFGKKFDVITAQYICFNGHKTSDLWGPGEWQFLIDDLTTNHLEPAGTIALDFNQEPMIGFYTQQLQECFNGIGARMYRGRVLIQNG